MSRVTVDLPLVPVMDTTGMRRSASRIQDGGVAPAAAMRASQPATRRAWVPSGARAGGRDGPAGEVHRRLGDQAGPLGARPGPGDHPAAGIRRAVDADRTRRARRGRRAAAGSRPRRRPRDPGHSRSGTGRARCTSDRRPGVRETVPGPRPADGDLDLDHRLQPVDVGPLEQPDLHESHGPETLREAGRADGRSAPSRHGHRQPAMQQPRPARCAADRLAAWHPPTTPSSPPRSSPRSARASSRPTRPSSPTSSGWSTPTAAATPGRRGRRRPLDRGAAAALGFAVTSHANDEGLGETVIAELRGRTRPGRRCCASATWTRCSTPGPPGSGRSRSRAASPPAPASRT